MFAPSNVTDHSGEMSTWTRWFVPYLKLIASPAVKAFCYMDWMWAAVPTGIPGELLAACRLLVQLVGRAARAGAQLDHWWQVEGCNAQRDLDYTCQHRADPLQRAQLHAGEWCVKTGDCPVATAVFAALLVASDTRNS